MGTDDNQTPLGDRELDALFVAATKADADVSDELMARIMADAAEHMPAVAAAPVPPVVEKTRWFAGVLDILGGAPAAAGLAMAAVVGVGFGYLDETVLDSTASVFGLEAGQFDVGDLYVSIPGGE